MPKSFPVQLGQGLFVDTTSVWDTSEIYSTNVTSEEFKELLVRLYQNLNKMSLALNLKDSGYYVDQEFVTGQVYFPNKTLSSTTAQAPTYRQTFRKVINFGALTNNSAKTVAHGLTITSGFTFTRIYGCSSNTSGTAYIPIPYASSVAADIIELSVDGTNVIITTASNKTAFTVTYVVLEFLKQ